ncbi:hypothetical protein [Actinomadura vinacea]
MPVLQHHRAPELLDPLSQRFGHGTDLSCPCEHPTAIAVTVEERAAEIAALLTSAGER